VHFKVFFRHSSTLGRARMAALLVFAVGVAVVGIGIGPEVAVAAGTASISGTVTGAGSPAIPVAGDYVSAYLSDGTLATNSVTDSSGRYQLSGLGPGSYTLDFGGQPSVPWLEQWWSGQSQHWTAQFFTVAAGAQVIGKDAVLPKGGTISGTVRASTHTPAAGVDILFMLLRSDGDQFLTSTQTAADGSYSVSGLASGNYSVQAFAQGSFPGAVYNGHTSTTDPSQDYVAVVGQSNVTGIDLTGGTPGTISGHVLIGGQPAVADVSVMAEDSAGNLIAGPDSSGAFDVASVSLDNTGGYSVSVAPGRYQVSWVYPLFKPSNPSFTPKVISVSVSVSVSSGQSVNGDIAIPQAATISGTITPTVVGVGGAIAISDSSGSSFSVHRVDDSGKIPPFPVPPGTYTLSYIPDSTYATQWWGGASTPSSAQAFTVTSGERVTKNFSLVAGATITGIVRVGGNGFSIGDLTVVDEAGNLVSSGLVVGDGSYTVSGLGQGTYFIKFVPHPGGDFSNGPGEKAFYYGGGSSLSGATAVSISAGQTVSGKDFDIPAFGAISGKLTDTSGNGLFGSSVHVFSAGGSAGSSQTFVSSAWIGADGTYSVTDLPPGDYKVGFTTDPSRPDMYSYGFGPLLASDPFVTQWYAGKYSYGSAGVVSVLSGTTTSGIDARLEDPTFADVSDPSYSFYPFIQWMALSGISTGTPQVSGKPLYNPANAVSRQAMASFLFKLSGETFVAPSVSTFADVDPSATFFTAIEWMASKGISTGTPQASGKPLFKPADAVSRQAMALFLARYAHANLTVAPSVQSFADVPLDAPAAAAVKWMKDNGISTGTVQPTGLPLYKPVDPVSRQAMAAFLYRLAHLPTP
jgi:hypothetical protein